MVGGEDRMSEEKAKLSGPDLTQGVELSTVPEPYCLLRWHRNDANSALLYNKDPVQANVQAIHGLVSCSEWTGVRLSTLLEETGIDPKAKWLLAEGADGPSMNRSIPIAKALDDAMIALYQNGERIAPSNGYPMRLLVPGYEGN